MDAAHKGQWALNNSQFNEAIQHYTSAITTNPTAVKYYIGRSTAYQRTSRYKEALSDAETAVVLAYKRGVRELIKDAQFRRALALYYLEQYVNASHALGIAERLSEKEKMLPIWRIKVDAKLKDMSEEEKSRVTIADIPDIEVPNIPPPSNPEAAKKDLPPTTTTRDLKNGVRDLPPPPPSKIKLDWYQSNESITINILAKNVSEDSINVDIEKDALSVSFPVNGHDSAYSYIADPLYASIDRAQSKYRVTPNKVEIILRKAVPGVKWHDLESDRIPEGNDEDIVVVPSHVLTGKTDSAPAYPTSSKTGAKNWDKLATEDLDDKDDIEGDETSHFFKKLYKDATPEQQRAMMKSYQESGGTVLSTDWNNVGSKTVVPEPPDGMEAKKY
ncbi:Cochaperone protein [Coniothyrium glycines]